MNGFYKSEKRSSSYENQIVDTSFNRFHELAKHHWNQSDSNLYFGLIPKKFLSFPPLEELYTTLLSFTKQTDKNIYNSQGIRNEIVFSWIKCCWLSSEFIKGGLKFRSPLCAHYNPRLNKAIIHPGGQRSKIIDLFCSKEKTPCFWFDTLGITKNDGYNELYEDMQLIPNNDIDRFFNELPDFTYNLIPEHGTFIPHIAEGLQNDWDKSVIDWIPTYEKNISSLKYYSNKEITLGNGYFDQFIASENESENVVVTFKKDEEDIITTEELSIRTQLKALFCMMARVSYEDRYLKVENKIL